MIDGASSSRCSAARRPRGRSRRGRSRASGCGASACSSCSSGRCGFAAVSGRSCRGCRSWLDRLVATCGSTSLGRRTSSTTSAKHAAELVALAPDVILASGSVDRAALLPGHRVPCRLCFASVIDPVGAGFVDSLARPGGNATGFIISNMALRRNGWSCSKKSRQTSRARRFFAIPPYQPALARFGVDPSRGAVAQGGVSPISLRDAARD